MSVESMHESRSSVPQQTEFEMVFSAARIAELMADAPEHAIRPTPEQAAVIEQPLGGSVLVIAGAGSGKTETMANRVVWLIANGLAEPGQILGLTFTRKAAGELADRIVERLQRFTDRLESASQQGLLAPRENLLAVQLHRLLNDGLDLPQVSTYNAFASAVVQEFGGLAGLVTTGTVIDEATAWGIAREIVCTDDDAELVESTHSIGSLVKQLMSIDHAVSDNLTSFGEVIRCTEALDFIGELPYNDKKREGRYKDVEKVLGNMRDTRLAARLAEKFANEKRRRGVLEFSDQLSLAVQTLQRAPLAIRELRMRTPVVLLDEVQDTSVGQTTLLSVLFSGCSVMAVGDPHQSIYGFRGASASNLRSFHRDFGQERSAAGGITLGLSTSWRNPTVVLNAANRVSASLAAALNTEASNISMKPLISRAQYLDLPGQNTGSGLEVRVAQTIAEEFESIAEWMRDARNEHLTREGWLPTAAVLFRKRAHMPGVSAALTAAGVPNRIIGLGGLLSTPEVTDLVCALRCIWQADASSELIRLLSGPLYRLGVADIQGLQAAARWFSDRDHRKQRVIADESARDRALPDFERRFTLLDALDEIASISDLDHAALRAISPAGRARLQASGRMLRELRYSLGADPLACIRATEQALRLDIELDAAEQSGHDGSAVARANLDAFYELVEAFLASDEHRTLASVLAWLERATEDDEVSQHVPDPEPGTVQLITVHGAKGLEWDLVAIPRLVEEEFPASPREGAGWLRPGELPDELRGDAAARPKLDLSLVETQKEVTERIAEYKLALQDRHAQEERRLAYVGITRAASRLLLTCSFWGGQVKARMPSVFLRELEAAGLIDPIPNASECDSDPTESEGRVLLWPKDPLGKRAESVLAAAAEVAAKLEVGSSVAPEHSEQLQPVVSLLLAERDADRAGRVQAAPTAERLTASTFHEFIEDPVQTERRRLRPMPTRPYRRTRTGNLFHEWVERRHGTALGTSLQLRGLEPEAIELQNFEHFETSDPRAATTEELQELIENFERSRWADLQPIAIELEITIPFAGRSLVCKLDAVYQHGASESPRFEIVDWKSGRPPRNQAERSARFLQLDLYRHAYAAWARIAPEQIDVTLFYVAEGQELQGAPSRDLEALEQLWLAAESSLTGRVR